jgi:hypothetical protein
VSPVARPSIGVLVVRGLVVVAAAAIVVTLALMSWPWLTPGPSADERRIADLQRLSHAFAAYHDATDAIPATLARLPPDPAVPVRTLDPVTNQSYDYRPLGPLAYELCARFDAPSAGERRDFWWHDAGRHCFSLELRERPRPAAPAVPAPAPAMPGAAPAESAPPPAAPPGEGAPAPAPPGPAAPPAPAGAGAPPY